MSSARREEMKKDIIPDMVVDPSSGKRYLKGRFLGKVTHLNLNKKFYACNLHIKSSIKEFTQYIHF